ncbi:kelch repeat-containing protein [Nitrosopumilus sp.]|nr:kelch repeat-containing protein [Nitrosopumilus sp.]
MKFVFIITIVAVAMIGLFPNTFGQNFVHLDQEIYVIPTPETPLTIFIDSPVEVTISLSDNEIETILGQTSSGKFVIYYEDYDFVDGTKLIAKYVDNDQKEWKDISIFSKKTSYEFWKKYESMPTARTEIVSVVVDKKIYVIGGYDIDKNGLNVVEAFDVENNSWEVITPLPKKIHHVSAVTHNEKIYVIGGYDCCKPLDDVFIFDTKMNSWQKGPSLPTPRGALTAQVINDKIYVLGGQNKVSLSTNEVLDISTGLWETKQNMPTPREHLASAVVDEKLYVIGGRDLNPGNNLAKNERYDPDSDSWETLEDMPTPRGGISAATLNDTIFVFGGETWTETYAKNEQYIPDIGWFSRQPMNMPRHGLAASTVGEEIFVIGGGIAAGISLSKINESYSYKNNLDSPLLENEIFNSYNTNPQYEEGGGCLIATAAYGSELTPQVQMLREIRDNQLLQTESGTVFIGMFNDIYYSFSPTIADMERENPMFKEVVKLAITPMISTLSLMENAESESEVLSIGLSVIALNLGMYLGIPSIVVVGLRRII